MFLLLCLLLLPPEQVLTSVRDEVAESGTPPRRVLSLVARCPFRAIERCVAMAMIALEAVKVIEEHRIRSPKLGWLPHRESAPSTLQACHALMDQDSGNTALVYDASPRRQFPEI